jgi:hypothetical protein
MIPSQNIYSSGIWHSKRRKIRHYASRIHNIQPVGLGSKPPVEGLPEDLDGLSGAGGDSSRARIAGVGRVMKAVAL